MLAKKIKDDNQVVLKLNMFDDNLFHLMSKHFDVFERIYDQEFMHSSSVRISLNSQLSNHWSGDDNSIDKVMVNFLEKIVTVFNFFNNKLETLVSNDELDPEELKKTLEYFSQSDHLFQKVNKYQSNVFDYTQIIKTFKRECQSFTSIKGLVSNMFYKLLNTMEQKLLHNEELKTPNSEDRKIFYRHFFNTYNNLIKCKSLQSYLNSNLNLDELKINCDKHIQNELVKISNHLKEILDSGLNSRNYSEFAIWFDNVSQFKDAFKTVNQLSTSAGGIVLNITTLFFTKIENISNIALSEKDDKKTVSFLFDLKEISENIAPMQKDVDLMIDRILLNLDNHDDSVSSHRFVSILNILNKSKTDPREDSLSQKLLNDHKAFEGNQLPIRNARFATMSAENMLSNQDDGGMRGDDLDCVFLKEQHKLFTIEYEDELMKGLEDLDEIEIKERAKECVFSAKRAANDTSLDDISSTRHMLVHLFAYWTLSGSEHYVSACQHKPTFDDTGDGANDEGSGGGGGSNEGYLKKPHAGQVISIFRLLGLDAGGKVSNHFIQLGTGEGKSVVLAIVASVLALRGFEVNCACYSEYLSDRDYEEFESLFSAFGVADYIYYNTFTQLCERNINSKAGDIRDLVQQCITNSSITNSSQYQNNKIVKRELIILIDEADVFFNTDFYGNVYRPLAKIGGNEVAALLDAIWNHRNHGSCGTHVTFNMVKKFNEYQSLLDRYPEWDLLIAEAVKTMIDDLKTFKDLNDRVVIKDGRIGYKDQDKVSFNISYGYQTLFAYYQANADGKVTPEMLKTKKNMNINCGSYSFAEIPKDSAHILGVSGTLETLSNLEKSILSDVYKIHKFSYTPSVFGPNKLKFSPKSDIMIESPSLYYESISNEINKRRKVPQNELKRPVLVFFETTSELMKYYKSSAANMFKSGAPGAPKMKYMTENETDSEKKLLIRQATAPGSITLFSAEFGRGTDFASFDERLSAVGGFHVIQTFLSKQSSQEVQIKGRAARQGCEGSYSMILSELHLETFNINKQDIEGMREDTSTYKRVLEEKRCKLFESKYSETIKCVAEISGTHKSAMKFLNIFGENVPKSFSLKPITFSKTIMDQIITFLYESNQSYSIEEASTASRTYVVLDATGSMTNLLSKAKNTIKKMFTEATEVLTSSGIEKGSFEIMFIVYRNYNAPSEYLLEYSPCTNNPDHLFQFLDTIDACYGWGNEAVEIGLQHVNNEMERNDENDVLSQVILIGDMPPNTKEQVKYRRESEHGESYWSRTKFSKRTNSEKEISKLKNKDIPVNAFYVSDDAKSSFQTMSQNGGNGGICEELDIDSSAGASRLSQLVTERILNDVGGRGTNKSKELIDEYRKRFHTNKGYTAD